jgi:hypothetical protein
MLQVAVAATTTTTTVAGGAVAKIVIVLSTSFVMPTRAAASHSFAYFRRLSLLVRWNLLLLLTG